MPTATKKSTTKTSAGQATISVPCQIARAYNTASEARREKAMFLMQVWFEDNIEGGQPTEKEKQKDFVKITKLATRQARKKGLTPVKLKTLLRREKF